MSQPASLPGTPGPRHRSGTTRDASRHHHQYTSPPLTSPILCNSNDTPRASWYRYNSRKKVDWGPSTETASYTVAKTHALYDDRQTPQPSLGPRTASPDTRVTDPDRRSQQHAHDLQARRSLGIVDELLRSNPSSPPPLYDWILPQPSSRVLEHENAPLSFADSLSDSSNAFSQAGSSLSKEMMILRESSPNARGPPPKSNCAKQIIDRPKRSFNPKSTFRDSAAYIEQLESQLAALQVQVQALASPSTKSSSTKLRALSAESRALRQQVADWESKFNERLSEAKGERAEVEKRLQIRIETMERDADTKIGKVKELEWELESAGKHAEDLQNLEAENVALGRRIDLLTGLLARSPTKLQLTLDTTEATVSQKRPRPRPLSMMPRISYTSDPDSLQDRDDGPETVARPAARHSASYTCSPRRISFEHALRDASRCQDEGNSPSLSSEFLFPAPSSPSTPGLCSSPHSTLDSCSSGSVARIAAWESPLPNMLDAKHKLPARRMMRRFHSGSNAPKALILPTAAHSGSFPMSAPALGISLDHEEPSTPKAALGAQYPRPSSPVKPRSSTDTFAVTDGADVHEETLLTEFQQGRTSTIDDHIESELCPDDEETVQNHEPSLVSRARSVSEPRRSSRRRRGQSFISDLAALISEIWEAPVHDQ
ncbi:MAG: hypothetical protein M1817_002219 [Caeruleum heppii]|nr:MAG: hypothetical protein M1817_002219 [Caeruleum heppii]